MMSLSTAVCCKLKKIHFQYKAINLWLREILLQSQRAIVIVGVGVAYLYFSLSRSKTTEFK